MSEIIGKSLAPIERGVAVEDGGQWIERDLKVMQRWRVRVVSDRAMVPSPEHAAKAEIKTMRDKLADLVQMASLTPAAKEDARKALAAAEKVITRVETLERTQRSIAQAHKYGHGEDFEIIVDIKWELWVRPFGTDTTFRKLAEMYGVSLQVVENVTAGIRHDIQITNKPGGEVPLARWVCSCNAGCRGWMDAEACATEAKHHEETARR